MFSEVSIGLCEEIIFNPALNCPRLMDDERSCDGSAFQTLGAATWKLRCPSSVLVKGACMLWQDFM